MVRVIVIHGRIWDGTTSFIRQSARDAQSSGASSIILDISSNSGSVSACQDISAYITTLNSQIPVIAYVHNQAVGPVVLIVLSCSKIAMTPSATIGGPLDKELVPSLRSAAQASKHNAKVVESFASDNPPVFTSNEAVTNGLSDATAPNYAAVARLISSNATEFQFVEMSDLQQIALWLVQPWATALLLALGCILVLWEVSTLHAWGIAGALGGLIVASILGANIAVGGGMWVGALLVVAGLVLLLFETHVHPGHFIPAAAGLVLIFVGAFFALGGFQFGSIFPMSVATLLSVASVLGFVMYLPKSPVWKRIGQTGQQTASLGYVSGADYTSYLGLEGVSTSPLRPSGTAEFDGERLQVQTFGDFVAVSSKVRIVEVQGSKIFVESVLTS